MPRRLALFAIPIVAASAGCENSAPVLRDPARRIVIEQPIFRPDANPFAIGGASDSMLAQVVTATTGGMLVEIDLPLLGPTITLQIQGVKADGSPSDEVLRSAVFALPGTPANAADPFAKLSLPEPLPVAAGERFAIVLVSGGGSILEGPAGDSYPGGHLYGQGLPNPPGWIPNAQFGSDDLPFRAWLE